MGVPSTTPPPIGSVGVGELLADAQTKTLWLGVTTSFDPQGSILVSDLIGLQQQDAADLATSHAYTDSVATGKSNVGHQHAISDITGLQAQLDALHLVLPPGIITIWSGILANIPAGWALCNGNNGTPDLRDKFVMAGGGNIAALSSGGAMSKIINTDAGGGHTHTIAIADTILSIDQMPTHTHVVTDPGHVHTITDAGHKHPYRQFNTAQGGGGQNLVGANNTYTLAGNSGEVAPTGIAINSGPTGVTNVNAGGSLGHNHTAVIAQSSTHTHQLTVDVTPAYVNLGYIMKVP